ERQLPPVAASPERIAEQSHLPRKRAAKPLELIGRFNGRAEPIRTSGGIAAGLKLHMRQAGSISVLTHSLPVGVFRRSRRWWDLRLNFKLSSHARAKGY